MSRVFFYTGFRMEVFEFKSNTLSARLDFKYDEEGIEQFKVLLSDGMPVASHLLVDLRDEDFIREQVPHVSGKDRQIMLERLKARTFRDAKYRYTRILGRRDDGRRDDMVLLSSLLETEQFTGWMQLFSEYNTPLVGIWSTAYLSEQIIKKLKIKDDNVLFFSRQSKSAVRETLFKKGKIFVSRQAKLERRVRKDRSAETAATIVATNVEVMQRFLVNQRILGPGEELNVYSILQDPYIEKAEMYCEGSDQLKFHFVGIRALAEKFGLSVQGDFEADTLFSFLCSKQPPHTQIYLCKDQKLPYYRFLIQQIIKVATFTGSIASVITATFLLLNSAEFNNIKRTEQAKLQRFSELYNQQYSQLEHRIADAQRIKGSVDLIYNIEREADLNPQALFPAIGGIFSDPNFSLFNIQNLQWEKHTPNEINAIVSGYSDLKTATIPDGEYFEEYEEVDYQFQPTLRISGTMVKKGKKYSDIVRSTEALISRLSSIHNVAAVHVLAHPVDVRLGSKFSDEGGAKEEEARESDLSASFDFRLLLKPAEPINPEGELYGEY